MPVPGTAKAVRQLPAALALIDGEHYPPVVRAALDRLAASHRIVAALFLGGAEKLRGEPGAGASSTPVSAGATDVQAVARRADVAQAPAGRAQCADEAGCGPVDGAVATTDRSGGAADGVRARLAGEYGVPLLFLDELVGHAGMRESSPESFLPLALQEALRRSGAAEVVDLSDEPVLGYRERFLLMSAAAAAGVAYVGADFELRPQSRAGVAVAPSLAVIGTGKRVGKTAISGAMARSLADAGERVVVVAMGRGGPPDPEVVLGACGVGPADLLAASRLGRHAASDHFEDAALAGDHDRLPALRRRPGRRRLRLERAAGAGLAGRSGAQRGPVRGQRVGGAAGARLCDDLRGLRGAACRLRHGVPRYVPPAGQRSAHRHHV